MDLQYTRYTLPLIGALALTVGGTAVSLNRREGSVESWSAALQVAAGLWVLCNLLMISTTSREWILRFYQLFFPCIALVVVAMMGFTLQFTGRGEWLTRRRLGLLCLYPAAAAVVSATNRYHNLVFANPTMDTSGSLVVLTVEFGPAVYANFLVGYALIGVYTALLVLQVLRSRNVYRSLSFVFLVMVVVMSVAPLPTLLGVSPFPYWLLFAMAYLVVGLGTFLATTSITAVRMLPVDRIVAAVSSGSGDVVPLARTVILQEVDNGILVLDPKGRVVDINQTAKVMLGLDQPVGRRLSKITDEDLTSGSEVLESVLWGDESLREIRDQVWVETERGRRCYDTRITRLTDSNDNLAGFVVLLHDITEQKESEQQLQQQRNELRTQTQQLEHQNERLDQFASIVSHDLRNPLNVATGNIDIALSDADDAEIVEIGRGRLETVRSAHDRMSDIIDDALTLARDGKAITETEPVTLAAVAEEAWSNVETTAATLEIAEDGSLAADRARLLTAFENLIRNSLDHGRSGDDHLTVRVGLLEADGFYVEDDGVGIPPGERDRVFEYGHTTSTAGTGLGLSIVSDIVNGHGWTIDLTESTDGGARVEISGVSMLTRTLSDEPMTSE